MTILIVEDTEPMHQTINELMSDLTETFTDCGDEVQALESYRPYRLDWVLMSIKWKEMARLVSARQIKAAFPSPDNYRTGNENAACARWLTFRACAYSHKQDLLELRRVLKN